MRADPVGIYLVNSTEPCFLVELWLRDVVEPIDFGEFTQEIPGQPRDNWQVPWDERILNDDGTAGESAPFPGPLQARGNVRVAFFFHYLDATRPLLSPCGPIALPPSTRLPERLRFIDYEPPG